MVANRNQQTIFVTVHWDEKSKISELRLSEIQDAFGKSDRVLLINSFATCDIALA